MGGVPVKNSDWELQMEPLYAVGELGFANAREEWSGVSLQVARTSKYVILMKGGEYSMISSIHGEVL